VNGESCYVKFGGNLSKHDGTYNINDLKIEESSLFMDEYAKGGEVEHQKLSASLKSKLKSANNILKRYGGREITEHEAIMWNVYHNATSGFEAGYEAFDVAGAKNYHNATTREHHAIGDNLIDISRAMTGVDYDDYNFRGTKEENENYYLMNYKNKNYSEGGDIAQGNYEMMLSQAKEVEHHVEELQNILKGEKDIDAWVVAKMENVSSTLSDITHYLDGKTEYAKGGNVRSKGKNLTSEISHYKVRGNIFVDFMDAMDYCDNVGISYDEIVKTKEYAHGGKMSRGGYFGKDALVKDLSEEFASEELLAKFRKKSGIKDTQLTKPNVIAFAYTDYGGDFMDKVAIEYFLENYPKNIVVENSGYNGKNAIVWGKVAMDWVEATEDYAFGYEDFESFYYDKVYKEEEQAFSEYLYELQRDGYKLDYDEVLQWLLENKGGYFSITTQGLDFYDGDLTKELLAEGLIEKSEEYARGGETKGVEWVVNFTNEFDRGDYVTKYVIAKSESEAVDKGYMEISDDGEESDDYQLSSVYKLSSVKMAKGGNIKSKTNKKMATKKVKDGQAAPQTKRWIFAFNKGGYNYYNTKEVPYKKPVDSEKKGAPVGYRFSKFAEEKGITNNRFRKPTKSEVEQYAGKKKNGKLIMYRETRSNKSDVNPKKKI
jgi:hypothetical protein